MDWIRLLLMLALVPLGFFTSLSGQETAPSTRQVRAVSVLPEGDELALNLVVTAVEPEGRIIPVRLVPRKRSLGSDGTFLLLLPTYEGTVAGRGKVQQGAMELQFRIAQTGLYELHLLSEDPAALPEVVPVGVHVLQTLGSRLSTDPAALVRGIDVTRTLLKELEPYEGKKEPAPESLRQKFMQVEAEFRKFSEATMFPCASFLVARVQSEVLSTVPFEGHARPQAQPVGGGEPGDTPYSVPMPSSNGDFDLAAWMRKLDQARTVAVREGLLALLDLLIDSVERTTAGDADLTSKPFLAIVSQLGRMAEALENGELKTEVQGYPRSRTVSGWIQKFGGASDTKTDPDARPQGGPLTRNGVVQALREVYAKISER